MKVSITNRIATLTKIDDAIEQPLFSPQTGEYIDSYYLVNNRSSFHEFNRFMFIYKSDGSLWYEGNLFLIDFIQKKPSISAATIERYVQALREFIAFCEPLDKDGNIIINIKYKEAEYQNHAPTHRFREHLIETKVLTKKSKTAVKRLMPPLCSFYEWMIKNGHKFNADLWNEKVINTEYGERTVRDVCQYENRKSDGKYIYDDGELRPLSLYEERLIRKAITQIDNTEYRLIFFIALNSMARKQTILTLRIKNILDVLPYNVEELPVSIEGAGKWIQNIKWPLDMDDCSIIVGRGHGVDVKGNKKNYPIKIKGWLLKQLVIYIISERAHNRRARAFSQKRELDQYIFLTDEGNPMYHAQDDPGYRNKLYRNTKEPQTGNGLDQFIKNELRPWLRLRGIEIDFHFHCLRATGALRFLEERGRKANRKGYSPAEWASDIEALRQLMGHSSLQTTLGYLRYMASYDSLNQIVNDVGEWYIEQMLEWAS